MDLLGPFPLASGQRRFVIVAIDYFAKWTDVESLATITSAKCEDIVWKKIVCRFGVPRALVVDNKKQFDNNNSRTFCANLSIELRFTYVAHPQSNGQSILQGLKKKLDEAKGTWVDELPKVLWAYRTTPHLVTGETPFFLCCGTEAMLPVMIGVPTIRALHFNEEDEEVVRAVVAGTTPSYSVESKLRDCRRADAVRREALQRITDKSLDGLPLDGFNYDFILG
ncbi:hypothetical protein RJ639_036873 [Escallonia herrerae]|uniref:Integrase catalytic domain-containing protein n=1 Tax=Escallonia herrerae TaxID=1293975 RepID=A0AA88WP37_9ASTE|nr:hypothetical protein RJ639_036873 [Escallonia herrerae]